MAAQERQLAELENLYAYWNERMNLISRRDIENLYLHHVLHSLSLAKVVGFRDGASVLDLGTGGGFPGVPLAILFPQVSFLLVDSVGKKIKAVQAIVKGLNLPNVTTAAARGEEVEGRFDFVVTRGVAKLKVLYGWCGRKVRRGCKHGIVNGILALKGGDLREELASLPCKADVFPIKDFLKEPFFETKAIVHLYR